MSQEKPEQRDWTKDRAIIEAASKGKWIADCEDHKVYGFNDRMIADCALSAYYEKDSANTLYIAESKQGWISALDEIDRLNATVHTKSLWAEIKDRDLKEKDDLIERQAAELHRRNDVIIYLQKEMNDLTAEVQEQDEKLSFFYRDVEAHTKLIEEYGDAKMEIKRLREVLEQFEKMPIDRSNSTAMKMRAIANAGLKGDD